MKKNLLSYLGIVIIAFLALAYFIPITTETGKNYLVKDTLLGIIIFHNPFILGLYLLVALTLIKIAFKHRRISVRR